MLDFGELKKRRFITVFLFNFVHLYAVFNELKSLLIVMKKDRRPTSAISSQRIAAGVQIDPFDEDEVGLA